MSLLRRILHRWRSRSTGDRGEDRAADHLREQGYTILARNVRSRLGEIDIVAQAPDGRTIVIVEVKASASASQRFTPEMHVTKAKRRKLITLATQFVRRHNLIDRPLRFDVIAVEIAANAPAVVRHHVHAFDSRG